MNKLVEIALKEYGTRAVQGENSNPEVIKYFHGTGFDWVKNDDTPWCAAFLNWILKEAGIAGTNSLLARSFLAFGEHVEVPEIGDIVVLWRVAKESIYGHAGLFIRESGNSLFLLSGNQDEEVKIKAYPKWQLLDIRRVNI